ncbi:uncharacterized protein [Nicotiana tomentosiformis]|uniref:uncharacterized protein n=1 Tax=Nicotiana tomentosiformis TaxID=4098 RepID=UPI00388C99C9
MGRGAAQPASSAATTSTTPPARGTPSPARHSAVRGSEPNLGGPSRFYAIRRHRDSKASLDAVTGILFIQSHDVYAFIDPGSTLSYVTPYVYRDCAITLHGRNTMDDLIELGMVDFDVIMGMDWLYSCFAKLDCRTRTVRFEFPNEQAIEWKGMMRCRREVCGGVLYTCLSVDQIDAEGG